MKSLWVFVIAVAAACDGAGSDTDTDGGNGSGDGGGSNDPDGGISGPRTVTLILTNRPNNAAAYSFIVGYQDGSAPWQVAPAPTGDTYSFTINAPSYSVAFACVGTTPGTTASSQRSVTIASFAVGERTSVTLDVPARCSDRMQGGVMLSGNVTNRPFGGVLVAQFGTRTAFVSGTTGNFVLTGVPPGTRDLVISHAVSAGNNDFYIDEAVVLRDVAVSGNTQKSINFEEAQPTVFHDVDPGNAPDQARVVASTTLYTANGTQASLIRLAQQWESNSLADAQMKTTDIYDQSIAVSGLGSGATVTHATDQPAPQTYVAPAPLGTVMTAIPTKQPYITLETQWPQYANTVGYTWNATQQGFCGGISCTTVWSAYLSPGVTGMMPAFRMPDLSALTGWKDSFQFTSSSIVGSVTAITSSAGPSDFPTGLPANGTDRAFVRSDYSVSP